MIRKITGICVLSLLAFQVRAGNGHPAGHYIPTSALHTDTLPDPKSNSPVTSSVPSAIESVPSEIQVVPRARKQPVPIPVTSISPKQIKVIPPTLIRPAIRILH